MRESAGWLDQFGIAELDALNIPLNKFSKERSTYRPGKTQIEPGCYRYKYICAEFDYETWQKVERIFNAQYAKRQNNLENELAIIREKCIAGDNWVKTLSRVENVTYRFDLWKSAYIDALEKVGFEIQGYEILRQYQKELVEFLHKYTPLYNLIHFHTLMLENEVGLIDEAMFDECWRLLGLPDELYITYNPIVTERNFRNEYKKYLKRIIKNFVYDLLPENHEQIFIMTTFNSRNGVKRYQSYLEDTLFEMFQSSYVPEYYSLMRVKMPWER